MSIISVAVLSPICRIGDIVSTIDTAPERFTPSFGRKHLGELGTA